MTIYMIESNVHREGYSGRYLDSVIEEDYGYFTDRSSAQSKVDELNDYDAKYAGYVALVERENEERRSRYNNRMQQYRVLTGAGLNPEDYVSKPHLNLVETASFENWVLQKHRDGWFDVIEIEEAK
jgi:hypothetical protein